MANDVKSYKAGQLSQTFDSIDRKSFENESDRLEAYLALRRLLNRLETPYETFLRRTWDEPTLDASLTIGSDINLWEALAKDNGSPKTVKSLAAETGVDAGLLGRICKHLGAREAIRETGADTYAPTEYSNSLLDPGLRAGVYTLDTGALIAVKALPAWLRENNHVTPTDVHHCPVQKAIGTSQTAWEWIGSDPELNRQFNNVMKGKLSGWKSAMELYPSEELLKGLKGDVVLVDVGGGWGEDLKVFYKSVAKWPSNGKIILQDQEHVLKDADLKGFPIEVQVHDFFKEQPVKGPRAFHMKQIIHDWPDDKAEEILKQLQLSMEPGYTKLLIHDCVIPATNAPSYATALDLTMMSGFGASERTQAAWERLFDRAGLHWEKTYSSPAYFECVLEVVRKE